MNIIELRKFVEHEAQWLKYYSNAESKNSLHFKDFNFYARLAPIGYTKRVIPLDKRCMAVVITSPNNAFTDDLETLQAVGEPRIHDNNCFSPLEVWIGRFPQDTQWILDYIQA